MKYHTTDEAAKQLKLSGVMVRRYCRQGRLGERIGRNWAISQADIDRFAAIPRKRGKPPLNSPHA